MRYSNYYRAQSLEEAYELLQKNKKNIIIGGMIWINLRKGKYNTVIDLCDLNLKAIEETQDSFELGAYTTLFELENDSALNTYYDNAFRDCLCNIEGVQLRNMANVGGTVVQRAGFSDLCTLLLALDAKVVLFNKGVVSIEEFLQSDRKERDILTKVIVPKTRQKCLYLALRNSKTDLPVLNLVASKIDDEYRLAVGARPYLAELVQFNINKSLDGKEPSKENIQSLSKELARKYSYDSNLRASAEYRLLLAENFIAQAIEYLEKGDK